MFLLYNFVLTVLAPVWVTAMLLKSRKRKEAPNWKERQGNYADSLPARKGSGPRLWVHAVSVGEFVAGQPLLKELRNQFPDHKLLVSVTTSSGHQTAVAAKEKDASLYDYLAYFPIDVPRATLSAMQRVQPDAVVILETELWMNFLWAAKACDAKTILANGRISDRSFPRKLWFRFFYRSLLAQMDLCLMQTEQDAERIRALGAEKVEVAGNIKFDQAIEGSQAGLTREDLGLRNDLPLIVIGSTRSEEEEQLVIEAIETLGPDTVQVIHAPRHLERVPALAQLLTQKGFQPTLRSKREAGQYLILDTYGELAGIYQLADLVIIGGGFSNLGGQNLLQPLAQGKPVIHGPHMQNFRDIAAMAANVGATKTVSTSAELASELQNLINHPELRAEMGAQAKALVESNTGATARIVQKIKALVLA